MTRLFKLLDLTKFSGAFCLSNSVSEIIDYCFTEIYGKTSIG